MKRGALLLATLTPMDECSYFVWQYREEGIAEGSRRNVLKKDVLLIESWLSVMLGWDRLGNVFLVRPL